MVGFNVALQLEVFGSVPATRKGVKFSQYWTRHHPGMHGSMEKVLAHNSQMSKTCCYLRPPSPVSPPLNPPYC